MVNNPDESLISQDKNLSQGLQDLIYKANTFAETAAEIIMQAYRYAIDVDGLQPLEAAKVLKDNLVYSPQWIRKQLPDEAKHTQMRREPIAKRISQIEMTRPLRKSVPQKQTYQPSPELEKFREEKGETYPNYLHIPPEKFRRFFMDLMKLRNTAEHTGIWINMNTYQVLDSV